MIRDTVGYLQIVVLDDEGAPSEVEVGLTVVDSFAKLFSDRVDDKQYLFFIGGELLRLLLWIYEVLIVLHLPYFHYKLD